MAPYDPKAIEEKWNKKWLDEKVFSVGDDPSAGGGAPAAKPKYYQLETFPYPSAAGLHMGHPKGYTAEDIHARFMRMKGRNVLYTMGWDAFGLPTENYAIKVGRDPHEVARENTDNFRRQVQMFGFSYDWDREIDTSSPEYYKWTQWLFIQLYKRGLAYRASAKVNWCPKDQTVLANEQVVDGACERCGTAIEEREMEQWFLRITDYADRLLDDLAGLDWPEATIKRQEDWIGRSEGAELRFALDRPAAQTDVVFATNNPGKFERMKKLFAASGLPVTLKMPADAGVKDFDVVEDGGTVSANAQKKARALAALTDLPVLADDTGFFIEGEAALDPVTVKRNALGGADEKSLTAEQIAARMQDYYKTIAAKHGGTVDAEWRQTLCLITPEKAVICEDAVRPVVLTAERHGEFDPALPLRGLYMPKPTGKYPADETEEEELLEFKPIIDAIARLFTPAITVFTTRPDTLFGATYLVLAPEHPFVAACIARGAVGNGEEVKKYVAAASHKTDRMRQEEAKEKTGVELKGVKAINPATKEAIPIWIADYVLGSYGTGAIMAVPAHDERDGEFAKKFGLPVRQVIEPLFTDISAEGAVKEGVPMVERNAIMAIVKHWSEEKYIGLAWKKVDWQTLITGGLENGQTPEEGAVREILEETGYLHPKLLRKLGRVHSQFFHIPKQVNRLAHFDVLYFELQDDARREISEEEQGIHEVKWLTADEMEKFLSPEAHRFVWREFRDRPQVYSGPGILTASGDFTGVDFASAKRAIAESVGGIMKTQYKLRDWSVSRQRYWGVPIPMIHCPHCGIVPVPESDLPVVLPPLENYRPQGMPPLAGSPEYINVKCPQCGGDAKRDPETLDTFVDSSWYFLRYPDPHNAAAMFDKDKVAQWMPVDLYVIGAEHTVLHLLYSRFITKFLHDEGLIEFTEPFITLRHQGLIMGADGAKMSKSKGNVVNPDEIVGQYGADATRLYLMFMGPFPDSTPWDPKGIQGVERFLRRLWRYAEGALEKKVPASDPAAKRVLHRAIKKVGEDIPAFKFNTAISALMITLNELETNGVPLAPIDLANLVKIVHPFAPHIAQELWTRMGHDSYLDFEPWPEYDPSIAAAEKIRLVLQVNSRTKDIVEADAGIAEGDAKSLALDNMKIKAALGGAEPKRIVYVEKKLVNIVI